MTRVRAIVVKNTKSAVENRKEIVMMKVKIPRYKKLKRARRLQAAIKLYTAFIYSGREEKVLEKRQTFWLDLLFLDVEDHTKIINIVPQLNVQETIINIEKNYLPILCSCYILQFQ